MTILEKIDEFLSEGEKWQTSYDGREATIIKHDKKRLTNVELEKIVDEKTGKKAFQEKIKQLRQQIESISDEKRKNFLKKKLQGMRKAFNDNYQRVWKLSAK